MVKKLCAFLIFCFIVLCAFGCSGVEDANADYLRLHIRANSNEITDQNIKLKVRDEVIKYLTPLFGGVTSRTQAEIIVKRNTAELTEIVNNFLIQNDFGYNCAIAIKNETFPTRKYDDLVLEKGLYRAIIITLGKGEGDNWWCVAYPPLCFAEGEDVTYKSKIWEIIKE